MKLHLHSLSPAPFQRLSGIIHFEGDIEHDEGEQPDAVFLRIGKRTIRIRRTATTATLTRFRGRFTTRTGFKLLRLFATSNAREQRLWQGLIHYTKKPAQQDTHSFLPPIPPFRAADFPRDQPARIAVILHLHYPDLWPELAAYISQISEKFDLYVSATDQDFAEIAPIIYENFPDAHVTATENKGRDILPFIQHFSAIPPGRYQYICKIHSKKALARWWADGDFWRRLLLFDLLGNPEIVQNILRKLDADPQLGLLAPWNNLQVCTEQSVHPNRETLPAFASRMGIDSVTNYAFPAGSMFWAKAAALEPLRKARVNAGEFPEETGQDDGTLAHVIERAFGLSVQQAGFSSGETPETLPTGVP
jgi:lipopolysaccharide biosynthesis protein